jgi:hypothetical protein
MPATENCIPHMMYAIEQNKNLLEEPGLFTGTSGLALIACYYGHYMKSDYHIKMGVDLLEKSLAVLDNEESNVGASFATGLAGIAWTINHLNQSGICELDAEELLLESDYVLYEFAKKELLAGRYDYMHDGLGGVLYLLSRAELQQNKIFLIELLHALLSSVEKSENGWAWNNYRLDAPNGGSGHNLSTAHGIMGILAILGMYYDCGIEPDLAREACYHICRYIKYSLTISTGNRSFIPAVVSGSKKEVFNERLSWCYGDLGASSILYSTGKRFHWDDVTEIGLQLGLKESLKRIPTETNISDSCLCHGYAGAAYIFNKWNHLWPHYQFAAATEYWNDQIISSVENPVDWSNYKFYSGYKKAFFTNYSLLDGLGGTLLSLLTQTDSETGERLTWDRALLLS